MLALRWGCHIGAGASALPKQSPESHTRADQGRIHRGRSPAFGVPYRTWRSGRRGGRRSTPAAAWLARVSLLCSGSAQNKMMWQQPQPVVKIATNALDSLFEGVHLSCAPQHAAANACIGVDIRLVAVEF